MQEKMQVGGGGYTKEQIDKIGNTIIYFSQFMHDLTKTKILKILFLLEEASIKKTGQPFIGIDFQLWKLGPVAKDIFIDLSTDEEPLLLKDYISRDSSDDRVFKAKLPFNDDEFSTNDIKLMEIIAEFVKNKPASYLVKHTHGAASLWRKSAIQYGVLELLENELVNSTEFKVDFSLLFPETSYLSERFEDSKENLEFIKSLKS
jgi:uncharacterized phage-associated protein